MEFFQSFFLICKKLMNNNIQLLNIFRNDIKREWSCWFIYTWSSGISITAESTNSDLYKEFGVDVCYITASIIWILHRIRFFVLFYRIQPITLQEQSFFKGCSCFFYSLKKHIAIKTHSNRKQTAKKSQSMLLFFYSVIWQGKHKQISKKSQTKNNQIANKLKIYRTKTGCSYNLA